MYSIAPFLQHNINLLLRKPESCPETFSNIVPYCSSGTPSSDALYLVSAANSEALRAISQQNLFALVACGAGCSRNSFPLNDRLIPFQMDFAQLEQEIGRYVKQCQWRERADSLLRLVQGNSGDFPQAMEDFCQILNCAVLVSESNTPILYFASRAVRDILLPLQGNRLQEEWLCRNMPLPAPLRIDHRVSSDADGHSFKISLIYPDSEDFDREYLLQKLQDMVRNNPQLLFTAFHFDETLQRILSGKITDTDYIRDYIHCSDPKTCFILIAILPCRNQTPEQLMHRLAAPLRQSLRNIRITSDGQILAAISVSRRNLPDWDVMPDDERLQAFFSDDWNVGRFSELLKDADAWCCIHCIGRNVDMMGILWGGIKDTLELAARSNMQPGQIIRDEDYVQELTVKYCIDNFLRDRPPEALRYLIAPQLFTLLRYDHLMKKDLSRVLRTFLQSGLDVSKTADILYLHKNSVYNRLRTIEELLGVDLRSPDVFRVLQHSFLVMDYSVNVLGIDIERILYRRKSSNT